jgi:cytochrome c oxidase subunit IV
VATDAPNVAERAAHPEEQLHPADRSHPGDRTYVGIALILAAITAAEVASFYFEDQLGAALVPLLILMMIVKFFLVAAWFMHLRFDSRLFTRLFVTGILTASAVYIAALATFRFF